MKMSEITKIVKPVPNVAFLPYCARILADIKEAKAAGEEHYEIKSSQTRTGTPYVITLQD